MYSDLSSGRSTEKLQKLFKAAESDGSAAFLFSFLFCQKNHNGALQGFYFFCDEKFLSIIIVRENQNITD